MSFDLRKSVFADELSPSSCTPAWSDGRCRDTGPLDLDDLFDPAEPDPDLAHKQTKSSRIKVKTW